MIGPGIEREMPSRAGRATEQALRGDGMPVGIAREAHRLQRLRNPLPVGGLPPVNAFWSITIAGSDRLMVANSAHKYSVSSHSGLQPNPDGSIDIYIQPTAPGEHEANWLPTPNGKFMLWLRAYEPRQSVLAGTYVPPAVTEVKP